MPSMSIAMSLRGQLVSSTKFSPLSLFSGGVVGVWFDPNDITTLFQDTAGTIPVTAPGQPVALMLDKSGNAKHATQSTPAQCPTYGVIPYGGVRNLITYSSDMSDTSWAKGSECSISSGGQVTPNNNPSWLATFSGITSNAAVYDSNKVVVVGQVVTFSVWAKLGTAPNFVLRIANGDGTIFSSQTITPTSTWTRYSLTATITVAGSSSFGQIRGSTTTAGTVLLGDAQYEFGSSASNFQKTVSKYNVSEDNKKQIGVLYPDGIDDWMVTPSISFITTDKMTVWAAIHKMVDATQSVIVGLSADTNSNSGVFNLQSPVSSGTPLRFVSRGTLTSVTDYVTSSFTAPTSIVVNGIGDISGDKSTLFANNSQVSQAVSDQGTGNYGNYPIYLFRRGAGALYFGSLLAGLVVRGTSSTATQINDGNIYLNNILGAY